MAKSNSMQAKQKKELLALYRQTLGHGQSLAELNQKVDYFLRQETASAQGEKELDRQIKRNFWQRLPKLLRLGATFLPLGLIALGLGLATAALWPFVEYYLPNRQQQELTLLSPIPHHQLMGATPLLAAQAKIGETQDFGSKQVLLDEPVILDQALDFTDLNNWFSEDSAIATPAESEFVEYRLDIPSQNISNALVRVGGTDLNQSLIQYPGTALPGQLGAPVIFGHSVLRQFYNPSEKNPRRYSSIFSKIMLLERGDKIYLTHDQVKYTYVVQSNIEVHPEDTFILAQRLDVHQLKLVTCTPEGTTLRRGIVTAQLVKE